MFFVKIGHVLLGHPPGGVDVDLGGFVIRPESHPTHHRVLAARPEQRIHAAAPSGLPGLCTRLGDGQRAVPKHVDPADRHPSQALLRRQLAELIDGNCATGHRLVFIHIEPLHHVPEIFALPAQKRLRVTRVKNGKPVNPLLAGIWAGIRNFDRRVQVGPKGGRLPPVLSHIGIRPEPIRPDGRLVHPHLVRGIELVKPPHLSVLLVHPDHAGLRGPRRVLLRGGFANLAHHQIHRGIRQLTGAQAV